MDEQTELKDDEGLSSVLDDEEAFEEIEEPLDLGELRESVENILYDEDRASKEPSAGVPAELLSMLDLSPLTIFQGLYAFAGLLQLVSVTELFALPPTGTQLARKAALQFALISDSYRLEREKLPVLESLREKIALSSVRYLDTLQLLQLVRGGNERTRTKQLMWLRDVMHALSGSWFSKFSDKIISQWEAWWAADMRAAGVVPPKDISDYIAKWAVLNAGALHTGEPVGHFQEALSKKKLVGEEAMKKLGTDALLDDAIEVSKNEPNTEEIAQKLADLGASSGRTTADARRYLAATAKEARELRDRATALTREIMELRSTNANARADYQQLANELAKETAQFLEELRKPDDMSLVKLLKPAYGTALMTAAAKLRSVQDLAPYRLSLRMLLSHTRGETFAQIAAMAHARSSLITPKRYAPVAAFSWSKEEETEAIVRLAVNIMRNI